MSLDEVRPGERLSNFGIYQCSNFQQFNAAAEKVKSLTKRPTDQELLELYALFKQGSFGDNTTSELTASQHLRQTESSRLIHFVRSR